MFSVWDFNSWIGSFMVVLFMFVLIAAFSAFVAALVSWILREDRDDAGAPVMSSYGEEPPFREAA